MLKNCINFSGHPQLIDDDEEDEEEDEPMEGKLNSEIIPNNESEDNLQCTAVKDLLEKYENGTIFCATGEKTVQLEEPSVPGEVVTSTVAVTTACENILESHVEEADEDEPMEEKPESELLPTTESENTEQECTSLKDLLEKQGSETSLCSTDEKVQLEEPSVPGETVTSTVAVTAACESMLESHVEEDEDEPMEAKPESELLPTTESENAEQECMSLKDLLEKQKDGTSFSDTEEKTVQLEESAVPEEAVTSTVAVTTASENVESTSESESQEDEGGNILSHYMLNEQS